MCWKICLNQYTYFEGEKSKFSSFWREKISFKLSYWNFRADKVPHCLGSGLCPLFCRPLQFFTVVRFDTVLAAFVVAQYRAKTQSSSLKRHQCFTNIKRTWWNGLGSFLWSKNICVLSGIHSNVWYWVGLNGLARKNKLLLNYFVFNLVKIL